jgi:hypothetical protein
MIAPRGCKSFPPIKQEADKTPIGSREKETVA